MTSWGDDLDLLVSSTPVSFLYVSDRDRALRFYKELGFVLRSSDDFGDFIQMPQGVIRMTVLAEYTAGPHPVLGWEVSDISSTARQLIDLGIPMKIYDGMGQDELGIWTAPDAMAKVAWFTDPDGNVLSLSQS